MSERIQKRSRWMWTLAVAFAAIMGCGSAVAQGDHTQSGEQVAPAAQVQVPARVIVVSLADRKLVLLEAGVAKRVYPVAVGKPSTPSPAGEFTIVRRVSNPAYSHRGKVVGPGPRNPVGSRWMGLSEKGYGIHGTNEPGSIGKAASHGCIRMSKADLEELFALVQVGDAVEIHAQHDAVVAMALGDAAPSAPAVLVAANAGAEDARQGQ